MLGNYCKLYEDLSSLARKVEQTDRWTDEHFWDSSSAEAENVISVDLDTFQNSLIKAKLLDTTFSSFNSHKKNS